MALSSESVIAAHFNKASYCDFFSEIENPNTGEVFKPPHSYLGRVKKIADEISMKVLVRRYENGNNANWLDSS